MQYTASHDAFSMLVTAGVFILFLCIGYWSLRSLLSAKADAITKIILSAVLLLLIAPLTVTYLYHTQKYVLGNFDLYIKRPVNDVVIKVKDITEIRAIADSEMNGTAITFGTAGLFGYAGKYHNAKLGNITLYATQQKNRILIYTKQGNALIITPDDSGFIDRIKMKMNDVDYGR